MLRSTLAYAPAVLMPRISALLSLVIMTRLLDESQYGLLVLTVTVGEMADMALSAWMRVALLRLASAGGISTGLVALIGRLNTLTTVAAMLAAAGGSVLLVPEHPLLFALATGGYILSLSFQRLGLALLQLEERRALFSVIETLRSVAILAVPVAAVLLTTPSFIVASLAATMTTTVFGVVALRLGLQRAKAAPSPFTRKEVFRFAGPLVLLAVLAYGINALDRVMLKALQDAAAVGLYAAAYSLARQPLDAVGNAVNLQGFPRIVARYDSHGPDAAGKLVAEQIQLILKLALPCAGLIAVLRSEIADFVLAPAYRADARAVMPIVAAAAVFLELKLYGFDNIFHAAKKNLYQSLSLVPAFITAIGVGLLLIPSSGATGAATTFLCSAFAGALSSALLGRRLMRVRYSGLEIGRALLSTALTLTAAYAVVIAFPGLPSHGTLFAGTAAGGLTFLASNALLHWRATQKALRKAGFKSAVTDTHPQG